MGIAGFSLAIALIGGACSLESDDGATSDLESTSSEVRGCRSGLPCQPANACKNGSTACSHGKQICLETGNKAAGTACGGGLVCNAAGTCVACTAGLACTPNSPCKMGITACATGSPVCVEVGNLPANTACGPGGLVCDAAGNCG